MTGSSLKSFLAAVLAAPRCARVVRSVTKFNSTSRAYLRLLGVVRGSSLIRCADRPSSLPPLSLELVQLQLTVAAGGAPPAVVVLNLSENDYLACSSVSGRMSRLPLPRW